ncbi:MAG: hypothetical protein ACPIOQ_55940, partial [Promethearchaeia archaeon]
RDPKMWTAWCIKYMEEKSLFCLYPNLRNRRAFMASWNEVGEHDGGDMTGRCVVPPKSETQTPNLYRCARACESTRLSARVRLSWCRLHLE